MQITIYTDGACDIHADNQPGGWATILIATDDNGHILKETVYTGGEENTTNNRMELTAVIEGLKALTKPSSVTIVSDSKYVINTVTKNYKINQNKQLWQEFFRTAETHTIAWKFVKGHAGHSYNERCDKLAVKEKNKLVKAEPSPLTNVSNNLPDTPIKIYLSTQVSSKKNSTAWSAIITYLDKQVELSDLLKDTTELEGVLIGAIGALETTETNDAVTLYTAQQYLSKGMNEWIDGWIRKNWKNNTPTPVKYQEHWKKLHQMTQQRTISFVFVKERSENPYFEQGKSIASDLIKRA